MHASGSLWVHLKGCEKIAVNSTAPKWMQSFGKFQRLSLPVVTVQTEALALGAWALSEM